MRSAIIGLALALLTAQIKGAAGAEPASGASDYPTAARADYVFGCMEVNGGTQDALQRCSCAIDVVAELLTFDAYERADTVLRMRQVGGGYLAQSFRAAVANDIVHHLQEAEAEAEVRCF